MSATAAARPPLRLRAATPEDAGAVADLGERAFVAKFAHLYSAENLATFLAASHIAAAVAAEIADPSMRVTLATEDGALVGFCKLKLACGWPEHARGIRTIELKQLYTEPARVGGGIGGALMDHALADARAHGADEMQISVWSGNPGAQRFYARYGFAHVADIDFWVGDHRDDEFLYAAML